jgi:GPI mannosyltransferase 2
MYTHWDAVYFLRVAQVGYEFEMEHAFFPLLPILINAVHTTCMSHRIQQSADGGDS